MFIMCTINLSPLWNPLQRKQSRNAFTTKSFIKINLDRNYFHFLKPIRSKIICYTPNNFIIEPLKCRI